MRWSSELEVTNLTNERDFCKNSGIPPTEVGGWFRSNLHAGTDRVLESHQRKLVDCSDPASEPKCRNVFESDFSSMRLLCGRRLDLNDPPTSVGGILVLSLRFSL